MTPNFLPVLVFDGISNPSKKVAHSSRYSEVPACKDKLEKIYRDDIVANYTNVLSLQKETVCIMNDILHTVLKVCEQYKDDV
jgi:hypothetical protein